VISLSSEKQVVAAIRHARSVLLTAYTLRPGRMADALEDAARRGTRVAVRLEGRPYADTTGELAKDNRLAVKALRRLGADAKLVDTNARNGPALHMKAAVCDGVAYLDDRNWPGRGDTIVRDDFQNDAAAIEAAAFRKPAVRSEEFWTTKAQALAGERRLLESATSAKRVDMESESFGAGSGTYGALKRLAESGVPCRLIVAQRDLNAKSERALNSLAQSGVAVRVSISDEKMAIVDGTRAWTGSANSTSSYVNGDQIDWGLRTDAPDVLKHLRSRFETTWNAATAFKYDYVISNNVLAFAVVFDAMSSSGNSKSCARTSAVSTTYAGSLRLPRCGTGARYGQSVSSSKRSMPVATTASRMAPAVPNVTMPPMPR